ncbi:hypothetical protein ACFDR9_000454 [Janthinobacterium sp. CG_23.3]|uniref:hypothetical protein n=1 Tax=Janthinobacterium sp. CG_23.3 TaxID=3349634 RepID=UPI0038D44B2D
MHSEHFGEYDIEYAGVPLPLGEGWGAHLTIYGPSPNPMHRNSIFPHQRVAVGVVFHSEEEAAAEARKVALAMLASGAHDSRPGT